MNKYNAFFYIALNNIIIQKKPYNRDFPPNVNDLARYYLFFIPEVYKRFMYMHQAHPGCTKCDLYSVDEFCCCILTTIDSIYKRQRRR